MLCRFIIHTTKTAAGHVPVTSTATLDDALLDQNMQ
jgi:hypothetical protein